MLKGWYDAVKLAQLTSHEFDRKYPPRQVIPLRQSHEARVGPFSALAEAGLPVICVETRHMRAVLKAQINKTDRNDARGIAQMMRVGLYRPVHVKTLRSQKLRMLLTHRKLLQSKAIAIDTETQGSKANKRVALMTNVR